MPQTSTVPATFGDSLRAIADLFDQVPSMIMAIEQPDVPLNITVFVKTRSAVEGIASIFESPVTEFAPTPADPVHTTTVTRRGRAELRVVHVDDEFTRELHRASSVVAPHEWMEP